MNVVRIRIWFVALMSAVPLFPTVASSQNNIVLENQLTGNPPSCAQGECGGGARPSTLSSHLTFQ